MFINIMGGGKSYAISKIYQSPFNLYDMIMQKIEQETNNAKNKLPAKIIAKMNSLQEPNVIHKLYIASQAGVEITLIIRGACALRPRLKSISDNIKVISIVGRFLEHHRIFYFYNLGEENVFLSSADWMKRNFFKRIETCVPILNPKIKQRIIDEGLMIYTIDNNNSWVMDANGDYKKRKPLNHGKIIDAQAILIQKMQVDQKDNQTREIVTTD